MNLPNAHDARVERAKIVDYLLASDHPEGTGKAAFFARFGFTAEAWDVLTEALLAHGRTQPVASKSDTRYGTKFRVEGPLVCPDGRSPSVRAVWIIDNGSDTPRLVTAYPI